MIGKISKLTTTHGSTWGKVRPDDSPREVFFNATSLVDDHDFGSLEVGQDVEFDEEPDRTNGMHAVRVRLIVPATEA